MKVTITAKKLTINQAFTDYAVQKLSAKLQNPGFVNKAPEHVVSAERDRMAKLEALCAKLRESIAAL